MSDGLTKCIIRGIVIVVLCVCGVACADLETEPRGDVATFSSDKVGYFEIKGKGFIEPDRGAFDVSLEYEVENGVADGYLKVLGKEFSVKGLRANQHLILNVGDCAVLFLDETRYYADRKYKFEYEGVLSAVMGQKMNIILSETPKDIETFYAENKIKPINNEPSSVQLETVAPEVNAIVKTIESKPESEPKVAKWGNCKLNGKVNQRTNVYVELVDGYNGYLSYGGVETRFEVSGQLTGRNLRLAEKHNGEITGVYNGEYDGFSYVGKYRRNDGKSFNFSMKVR